MAEMFSLKGQNLKLDTSEDVQAQFKAVNRSGVKEIDLQGNTFGPTACKEFAESIKEMQLESANLSDIFTGRLLSEIPAGLNDLLTALLEQRALHSVNLSDNAFGLNTVEPLRPFLSKHAPLQTLILNNNGLGPQAGSLVGEALTQLAQLKSGAADLETVQCGRNRLENGSMAAWAKAYTANTGIRHVRMVQNGIRPEGIILLIREGLSKCSKLEILDLQDNTFTATGSRALADAITAGAWPELKELGVGDCLLSARGGVAVFTALAQGKCPKLEVLRLQYNEIDAKGVKALADGLKAMPELRKIELNGNKFEEDDASILKIRETLDERREAAGEDEDEERWGLDELDDLEEEDSDEEAEDDEEVDEAEAVIRDADAAEAQPVAAEQDADVDALASKLGKTEI